MVARRAGRSIGSIRRVSGCGSTTFLTEEPSERRRLYCGSIVAQFLRMGVGIVPEDILTLCATKLVLISRGDAPR